MILYNRVYRLSVGAPVRLPPDLVTGALGKVVQRETRTWEGLKITFEFEKNMDSTPNKGSVSIWNLSNDSIGFLRNAQGEAKLELEIGYGGNGDGLVGTLCRADVISVGVARQRPDTVVTLELGENETNLETARIAKTFNTGSTWKDAILNTVSGWQVNLGAKMKEFITDEFLGMLPASLTANGKTADFLKGITERFGMSYSIQNDEFIINEFNNINDAIELSSETGLIGEPADTENGAIEIVTLIDPRILPGRIIDLKSKLHEGRWKVEKGKYKGDTHGEDWTMVAELVAI